MTIGHFGVEIIRARFEFDYTNSKPWNRPGDCLALREGITIGRIALNYPITASGSQKDSGRADVSDVRRNRIPYGR